MQVYSLIFLCLALPGLVLLCRICPVRGRSALLLGASALFYWWLEGENLLLLAGLILFDFAMSHLLERCGELPRLRRAIMVCTVAKSLGIFALYQVRTSLGSGFVPLGLGVVCLTSAGYVVDCYLHNTFPERSLIDYGLLVGFFPKLYAGPLVYHSRLMPQIKGMRMTLEKSGEGVKLFLRGLGKKVLLGDVIYRMSVTIRTEPAFDLTPLTVWTLVVTLALSLYFILSGLCDMAKGMGLLFGLELPDNFHNPFGATSVNDFFARFNSSVSKYLRRYVYFHLGGARGSVLSSVFNILLVTILIGLWFGISVNLMLWGVYFTVFILFERYFLSRYEENIPPFFRWFYCTAVVLISFAFFGGSSPAQSLSYLRIMFGLTATPAFDSDILYLLASNYLVLLVAALSGGGLFGWLSALGRKTVPRVWNLLTVLFYAGLAQVVLAFLVG